MDYNNPYIPEEDKVQEVDTPKIDPMANIRMTNPETGETVWAPNHMVDDAVKSGWDFANPDAEVPVYNPVGKSSWVRAGDLAVAQGQGYGYKGFKQEQYDVDLQTGKLVQDAMEDTTLVEDVLTAGSSMGRGATFGLSDLIATGIIEGLGSLGAGYEKGDSEEIYQIRELSPTLATSAEILGGLITAGGMTKLGAQSAIQTSLLAKGVSPTLARVAASITASTAEGAAYGLGTTTADYAMDKPEVGLDTIMFNTGVGGAFGLFGAGALEAGGVIGSKVVNAAKKARAIRINNVPEVLPTVSLDPMQISSTNQFMQNIFDVEGNRVGTIVGAVADPAGVHRGAQTGLSIERIIVGEGAPEGVREATVNALLKDHASIFARGSVGTGDEATEALFRNMGTKITSKSDDAGYYGIFEAFEPDPAALAAAKSRAYKAQKFFGRVPKEAGDEGLYNKFLNNPKFFDDVIDYHKNPEKLIREGVSFIGDINKNRKAMTAAMEDARKAMISQLDEGAMDVVRYKSIDLEDVAKKMAKKFEDNPDLYSSRSPLGIAQKVSDDVQQIVYAANPSDAFTRIRELRQIVDEEIKSLGKGRTSNLMKPLAAELRTLEREVAGEFGDIYAKIQAADSKLIIADKQFAKNFLTSTGETDAGKIFSSFSIKSPGTSLNKAWTEHRILTALEDAHIALKEAKSSLGIEIKGFDPRVYSKRTVSNLQEIREAATILKTLETGSTSMEKAVDGVAGAAGAMGTVAAIGGGPAGSMMFAGMYAGRGLASMAVNKSRSPLTQFARIRESFLAAETAARQETRSTIRNFITKDSVTGLIINIAKSSKRTGAILGLKDLDQRTREERLNEIIKSIDERFSPTSINLIMNQAEESIPGSGNMLKAKLEANHKYIKDNAPADRSGNYNKVTKEQEEKLASAIEVVFDPLTAFKRALASGDALTLQVIFERYPDIRDDIAKITQSELEGTELDSLSMKKKRVIKTLTQGMMQGTDQQAQASTQAIYSALRGKEEKAVGEGSSGRPRTMKSVDSQKAMTSSQRMSER